MHSYHTEDRQRTLIPKYSNSIPISPMAQKTILLITKIIKQIPCSTPTLAIGKLPKVKIITPIDGRK